MMTALLVAFTSFALVACGGDDDSDDPVQPTLNKYKFSLQLSEKEQGQIDDFKAIFPDLSLTYTLPGKSPVTVPVGKDVITAESETSETGRIEIKFTGTLDESKLDENKKYSFYPQFVFFIHQDGYTQISPTPEIYGFGSMPGSNVKAKYPTKFEYVFHKSLTKLSE